jgi:Tfp pilus assembly protein PilN
MPKRCIGLDLGRTHLCAAQVVRTTEGFRLEKAFARHTRRSSDSLPALLQALTERYGFDRRAPVAVSLPGQAFFFADIETSTPAGPALRAQDIPGLSDHFPIPAEDLIAQICSVLPVAGGPSSVLVAAASRRQLAEALPLLEEGHVKPVCLDTPITAAHAALLVNHPQAAAGLAVLLYVETTALSLAVIHDGRLLLVRHIPLLAAGEQESATLAPQAAEIVAQEIEITWKRLFGTEPDPGLPLYLIAPRPLSESLTGPLQDKTGGQVIPVDPYARVVRSEEVEAQLPICVAEGLALRALQPQAPGALDFLAAYRLRTRPKLRLTKELTVCGSLAAAAAVVWAAGLLLQLSSLEATHRQLKQQIEAVFHQAVPEEQNLVDPAAQLQQRLDAGRKEAGLLTSLNPGRSAPLEVLYTLSRSTPAAAHLKLDDVTIAADSVHITGNCDSFATFSEWQRQLEALPGWHLVDAPHSAKDAKSGKVRFTLALSTTENKA